LGYVQGNELNAGERLARLAAEAAGAESPGAALRKLRALQRAIDTYERELVARVLAEGGSYAQIGRELGLSRQAVHRRYRDLQPATTENVLAPSDAVRLALRFAREEAAALAAPAVGGEHMLLGLLRAAPPGALENAGVTLTKARLQVEAVSPRSSMLAANRPLTDVRALLTEPAREALRRGSRTIEATDLLAGLLRDPAAARTLRALGADPAGLRARLESPQTWVAAG
jgi:hypothetical protein